MWHQGGWAANDEELERGPRSMLQALWEEPARFSRNRHFEALQTAEGRAARRDINVCRSILSALGSGVLTSVRVKPGKRGLSVTLVMAGVKASRVVVLSSEAFALLLTHPDAAQLRALLPEEAVSRPGGR